MYFFKLLQLRADARGETDPGDGAKGPSRGFAKRLFLYPHVGQGGTTPPSGLPGVGDEEGGLPRKRLASGSAPHPRGTGRRDLLFLTHPLHQHTEITAGLEALPPPRQEDATCIPAMVPPGPASPSLPPPPPPLLGRDLARRGCGAAHKHHTLVQEMGLEHPQQAPSGPQSVPVPSAEGWRDR